jgi:hypothetical protein
MESVVNLKMWMKDVTEIESNRGILFTLSTKYEYVLMMAMYVYAWRGFAL